jgi:hypothetical protein
MKPKPAAKAPNGRRALWVEGSGATAAAFARAARFERLDMSTPWVGQKLACRRAKRPAGYLILLIDKARSRLLQCEPGLDPIVFCSKQSMGKIVNGNDYHVK